MLRASIHEVGNSKDFVKIGASVFATQVVSYHRMTHNILLKALCRTLVEIPDSTEPEACEPEASCERIIKSSCRKTGLLSAGLSIPMGPLGLVTLMPELTAVWKIQSQMVSDIASVYGKQTSLTREQMLFFLFRHSVSHLVGDVVKKSGERFLVQTLSQEVFERLVQKLALRLSGRLTMRAAKVVFPLVGAGFVGAYSYVDTLQVGRNTQAFFNLKKEQMKSAGEDDGPEVYQYQAAGNGCE